MEAKIVTFVKCQFCPQQFVRLNNYYLHANLDHFNEVKAHWVKCLLCPKFYPSRKILNRHKAVSFNIGFRKLTLFSGLDVSVATSTFPIQPCFAPIRRTALLLKKKVIVLVLLIFFFT
jgi:hypothetical protein